MATWLQMQGVPPCSMVVSSASGGSIAVEDSNGAQLYKQPPLVPVALEGTLASGQQLTQVCSVVLLLR